MSYMRFLRYVCQAKQQENVGKNFYLYTAASSGCGKFYDLPKKYLLMNSL